MALQQELGLWPQRRTRSAGGNRNRPPAVAGVLTQDGLRTICNSNRAAREGWICVVSIE